MANVFKDAAYSFYSGPLYGELARARKGIGFGLILLLTLLISALMCAGLLLDTELSAAIRHFPQVAADLPEVTFKDGSLSIDKPAPYRVSLGLGPQRLFLVIDTDYKVNGDTAHYMQDNGIIALITGHQALLAKEQWKHLEVYELAQSRPFVITHEQWVQMGRSIEKWGVFVLMAVFFISYSIVMFVLNMLATGFTAIVILAVDTLVKAPLNFSAAMRIASAVRIPVNILPLVPVLFGYPGLASGSGWVLWGIYIGFALAAVRISSKNVRHEP